MNENSSLYSIGHGTRKADDFLALLNKYHIRYLIDVRTLPFSRFNPQYNQKALTTFLALHNIHYVFMGDTLGGRPKDPTCYNESGRISYDALRNKTYFEEGIERLKTAFRKAIPAAIMCSERKPQECHRSLLIGKVLLNDQIDVMHIDEAGGLKKQTDLAKEFKRENFMD